MPVGDQPESGDEVLLVDLKFGDRFVFDDFVFTVIEPPQCNWGLVEVWIEEQDWPFEGGETSTVQRTVRASRRTL